MPPRMSTPPLPLRQSTEEEEEEKEEETVAPMPAGASRCAGLEAEIAAALAARA